MKINNKNFEMALYLYKRENGRNGRDVAEIGSRGCLTVDELDGTKGKVWTKKGLDSLEAVV
jgi:hypothetical protein